MNYASYEYRNISARRGAQFVPTGMPIICKARSLCKRKVLGSNPTVGNFSFVIKPMQMKSTMTYSELIPYFRKRFARKNMAAVPVVYHF